VLILLVLGDVKHDLEIIRKAYKKASLHIDHITPANIAQTKIGDWVIFYGSSTCAFCQHMTVAWLQLQNWAKAEQLKVNIGKVECLENPKLCEDIDAFPKVRWFKDGKMMDDKFDEREIEPMKEYIQKVAASKPLVTPLEKEYTLLNEQVQRETKENPDINPDGKLVHLTDATFDAAVKDQPWVLMFHAPWCGHCQGISSKQNLDQSMKQSCLSSRSVRMSAK
jgi:thioredoxin-like negative regulator of GroEL